MAEFGQRFLCAHGERRARRLVQACGVLFVLAAAWFVVFAVHPVGPVALLWVTTPLYGPLVAMIFWYVGRSPALPEVNRRFWRHLGWAALLVGVGQCGQVYDLVTRPGVPANYAGPVMLVFDGAALLIIIYALLRLPLGRRGRGDALRIVLDAGTVVVAAAVFIWHFGTRQAVGTANTVAVAMSLVLVVLALLGVFALTKVLLSDIMIVDRGGLRLLAAALFIGALAPMAQPWVTAVHPRLIVTQVSVPAVFLFGAMAGQRQLRTRIASRRHQAGQRRPFSVLPYTAVAAVDGLLLWTAFVDRGDLPVVTVAAVLLTVLVVVRQITALRDNGRLLRQLDHGANHDALTGLPNRTLFRQRLDTALAAPGRHPVAVALIDLDDFKEVNDTLGHEIGDLLLVEVAGRLATATRAEDTVARLGGDEFVVVLDGADPAAADTVAARVIEALDRPVSAGGNQLPIHASIGIADGRSGDDASALLRHADIAMYAAKRHTGTTFLHYDTTMRASTAHHGDADDLRTALRDHQLFLHFQPIVSLPDGRVLGAEAFVRWAHPQRGTLAPDEFIPVAERTGLVAELDRWVLDASVRQLARWDTEHGAAAPAGISVNVSARTLREASFADDVAGVLTAYDVVAGRVTVEITETVALEPGPAVQTLHRLRHLGVRISLDDFGTHYSTLRMLHDCPVDEIKLDRSFTQAQTDDRTPMAAAVIHLARALGLHAVAEGAETPDQAAQLAAMGYPAAQGYHFARPQSAADFTALLRQPDEGNRALEVPAVSPEEVGERLGGQGPPVVRAGGLC